MVKFACHSAHGVVYIDALDSEQARDIFRARYGAYPAKCKVSREVFKTPAQADAVKRLQERFSHGR
jgi:hypothetical protein